MVLKVIEISNNIGSNITLESAYYISQIVSAMVVIFTLFFAIYQFRASKKDNRIIKSKESIQKAIDLSGFYKDSIIEKLGIIRIVYKASGILEILETINKEDMVNFDKYEISKLLSKDKIDKIESITKSKEFTELLLNLDINFGYFGIINKENGNIHQNIKPQKNGQNIVEVTASVNTATLMRKFNLTMTILLNNLEFFAMHFNYETADRDVVYQSIHQSYIQAVSTLYYDISINNEAGDNQVYTNVKKLYGDWIKNDILHKSLGIEATRNATHKVEPLYTQTQKRA